MKMKLQTARPGMMFVDTDRVLSSSDCDSLRENGISGVFRYLEDLTAQEVETILTRDLILCFVNHSRSPGWQPSAELGRADGERDVSKLRFLGIPAGVHVSFDLEGPKTPASLQPVDVARAQIAVIAHVSAHALVVQAAASLAALYVGAGALLTSRQLYALPSTLYWHGCSHVTDAIGDEAGPECGWAVVQGYPPNVTIGAGVYDYDAVFSDFKGRLPVGVVAG